ncbi:proton channel OTOP2, partial [Callorhinchus milii]|uniref:proton channel OTOP2 n=1 Tax=Callorhinchus milii TaxID=7868 RepID=UPI001C3FD8E7
MQTISGEITEGESSSNVMGPHQEGNPQNLLKPANDPTSPKLLQNESGQRVPGANLLSAVLASNIGLLGIALISVGAIRRIPVGQNEVHLFLTIMMLLALCWILFYVSYIARHKHIIIYRDTNAGPVWLRGGLLLFAGGSLLLHLFKIGYFIGSTGCQHPITIIFFVTQIAFLLAQTYFLWVHCKTCVQLQQDISRCGLSLLLTSNLMLWVSAVTDEFLHQTDSNDLPESKFLTIEDPGNSTECHCNSSICHHLQLGSDYLYPFNIEYNLFASTMVYVMWKNVGRFLDQFAQNKGNFYLHGFPIGLVLGLVGILVGLVIFIICEVKMTFNEWKIPALIMYYIFNIVLLSLMSMVSLLGSFIYILDKRSIDQRINPTRNLEVNLLLGTEMGQFSVAYFSIVALVSIRPHEPLAILSLMFSLITIIQHALQSIFIIKGLYRQPFSEPTEQISFQSLFRSAISHLYISPTRSEQFSDQITEPTFQSNNPETHSDTISPAVGPGHVQGNQLTWKRRFLKEITSFLLLSNII